MTFNRYLLEAELAANKPVVGDRFNILVNEAVNIQTTVTGISNESVTVALDSKATKILENIGIVFESHTYVSGRDFQLMPDTEYRGYVMGDESYEDDDRFTKHGYGVYKFVNTTEYEYNGKKYKQNHYQRVSDLIDPATGKEPSPYAKGYQQMFKYTVDKLTGQIGEGKEENFTIDDIKSLEKTTDLNAAKAKALALISTQGKHKIKPNKLAWLKHAISGKDSVAGIVKLMYDLMLSGEGHTVIGSRYSTRPNLYQKTFGEDVEMADLRRLSGLGEGKTKRYVVVHLPNGQTTKRQFTIDASSDEEAKAIAATRMKDRPNSKLISIKHDKPLMHKPNLIGESNLHEGYEDRVQAVADRIAQYSKENSIKKSEIDQLITTFSAEEPEYKMKSNPSSKAWPDFVKDVKQALTNNVRYSNNSAAVRAAANNQKLAEIAQIIMAAVGNAFPDGDPFDAILPKVMRRYDIPSYEVIDWLDKAARKHLGTKNYYDYLRQVWQDYMDDNPGAYGLRSNPWTSESLEEDADFIIGDRVKHKENGRTGRIVGDPTGNEYPVEFDDEKGEAYYVDSPTLMLSENTQLKLFAMTENGNKHLNFGKLKVDITESNTSGSIVLHQIVENTNGRVWTAKITTTKSAIAESIRR